MKRSQSSLEYMTVFALVLVIIVPSFLLFKSYALESNEQIVEQNIDKLANDIINNAVRVYYQGVPSKMVLEATMPATVTGMWIVNDDGYNLLGFNLTSSVLSFESDVPMSCDLGGECVPCTPFAACGNLGVECSCFADRYFTEGKKRFEIQATNCGSGNCAQINWAEV